MQMPVLDGMHDGAPGVAMIICPAYFGPSKTKVRKCR
jgi:hypothetical protein